MRLFIVAVLLILNCSFGKTRELKVPRIVNGEPGQIEDFPYQVLLMINDKPECGGAIYSADIIITAAHCLEPAVAGDISVRVGSTHSDRGGVVIPVIAYIYHEKYNAHSHSYSAHDIGIAKLKTPLTYGPTIRNISLATEPHNNGDVAFVSGYGENRLSRSEKTHLQYAEVTILDHQKCTQEPYKYTTQILKGMVCAAGGYSDACAGDSGGPLVSQGRLVGIISFGPELCGNPELPGVYADVAHYHKWIMKHVGLFN